MRTLLDPPSDNEKALLRVVAEGYTASGQWPLWQYVDWKLDALGINAVQVLAGLPTWKHHYSYFTRRSSGGNEPERWNVMRLTVAGMNHADHAFTNLLAQAFVAALREAVSAQRKWEPSPISNVDVHLIGQQLTVKVNMASGTSLTPFQVNDLLQHEPATWRGLPHFDEAYEDSNSWEWAVSELNLHAYRDVSTVPQYLAALESVVGFAPMSEQTIAVDPMALPNAIDHLNITWQLRTGEGLLAKVRVGPAAALSQPATTQDEFESRFSSLGDLLNRFTTAVPAAESPTGQKLQPLVGLEKRLGELLGVNAARAVAAVKTLRQIMRVRAGQQHRGADRDVEKARNALRLDSFGTDWAGAWDHVRGETVRALTTIREEIVDQSP